AFVVTLNCPSYHPRTHQRASDGRPEREIPRRDLRPRARPGHKTRLLLAARSRARGFESLACQAPDPTHLGRPPEHLPRLAASSVLAVTSLAGVTPRPTTVWASL